MRCGGRCGIPPFTKRVNPVSLHVSVQIVLALRAAEPIPRASRKLPRDFRLAMLFGPSEQQVVGWALFFGLAVCQRETRRRCKTRHHELETASLSIRNPESKIRPSRLAIPNPDGEPW
jgi:hypothetical protein